MNMDRKSYDIALDTANHLYNSGLRLFRVLRTLRSTESLSVSKLGVLGRLYRDGTKTAAELALYLRVQPQSLTRLLDDLETRSLISRKTNPKDRRQSFLEIIFQSAGRQYL